MTSSDYGELVKRLRSRCENVYDYATQGAEWQQDALCMQAADAIEQLTRPIASDYGELVLIARARRDSVYDYATQGAEWQPDELCNKLADAIDHLSRELAACEGALRNSGNMVRDLNDLAKQYENELTRHKRVTDTLMAAWPKGVPMPEWEEPAEPDTRGTGYAGEVGCG